MDLPVQWLDSNCRLVCGVHGDKGVRKQMEDEHLICHSLHQAYPQAVPLEHDLRLYGVFDGHGGRLAATFVKDQLPREIANQIQLRVQEGTTSIFKDDPDIHQILNAAFSSVDSRIALELPSCKDGCTAIVIIIKGLKVVVANLGDAQAMLARRIQGSLHAVPLNELHKPWVIQEKDRIIATGGTTENGRVNGSLEVTRSFGDLPFKKFGVLCTPTLRQFTISTAEDEFIAIGCDGFWNCWSGLEAVTYIQEQRQKVVRRLKVENGTVTSNFATTVAVQTVEFVIVEKKTQDNVTALLLFIEKD